MERVSQEKHFELAQGLGKNALLYQPGARGVKVEERLGH